MAVTGPAIPLPHVRRALARRLQINVAATGTLTLAAAAEWRLLTLAGLRDRSHDEPGTLQLLTYSLAAGALLGSAYALARPLLPRQPELAGLTFAVVTGTTSRALSNMIVRRVGLRREADGTLELAGDVVIGLWIAQAERLFEG